MSESDTAIRIAVPDLNVETLVHSAGIGLINCLANDLFGFINTKLSRELGSNWLADIQAKDLSLKSVNYRDPSLLFNHLTLPTHPDIRAILRKPINAVIPKNNLKDFYALLEHVLGERHLWFHRQIEATPDQLRDLAVSINKVAFAVDGLAVVRECKAVLDLFQPKESQALSDDGEMTDAPAIIQAIQNVTTGEELSVGSPVAGPFLPYTYTLTLAGIIRDRKADLQLDQVDKELATSLGALLIARKPSGGRLRITNQGVVAAFFGEEWGYLAQVTPDKWFPGHLI